MVIGRIHFVMVMDWFGSTFGRKNSNQLKVPVYFGFVQIL